MTKILRRLDQILERVDGIGCPAKPAQGMFQSQMLSKAATNCWLVGDNERSRSETIPETPISGESIRSPGFADVVSMDEMSKDYLRIPTSKTTADTLLTWPIFQGRFPRDHLTTAILSSQETERNDSVETDVFIVHGGFEPLSDERIPYLIGKFLENVHTKNPILDVDALIQYGRKAAVEGPAWDAPSCLVLLACALGSISLPFESSVADRVGANSYTPLANSSTAFARPIQQAESCYSLACRRLGLLKHTVLGAQCFFYSGGTASRLLSVPQVLNISQYISCIHFILWNPGTISVKHQHSASLISDRSQNRSTCLQRTIRGGRQIRKED